MNGPFIHIGTYAVKSGKLEECRKKLNELVDLVEANEPRLIAFNVYFDESGGKVSVVQVHTDAASMQFHLTVIAEHLYSAGEYLDQTVGIDIYGTPPDGLVERDSEWVAPDALRYMPIHEAGFTRTNAR